MRKIQFLFFSTFLFLPVLDFAQVVRADLPYLSAYREEISYFQELITGGQYAEPSLFIKGDPYHISRQFERGTLRINGITYPDVPLLYDSYQDQLLTFHPIFNQKILIKPEKIDGFVLGNGDHFRFFTGNESYPHHGNGIYQVLEEKKTIALSKPYKTTKALREISRFQEEYLEKVDYFLYQEGGFHPIKKASDAYVVLGLDQKIGKKEVKSKGLSFKKSPPAFLKFIVSYSSTK